MSIGRSPVAGGKHDKSQVSMHVRSFAKLIAFVASHNSGLMGQAVRGDPPVLSSVSRVISGDLTG